MVLSLNAFGQAAADMPLGQIKAAKVEGEVTRVVNGANVQLKNGETIVETDVITTGPTGSIVLVFLNGSSVKLGAKSKLAIDSFRMDPLDPAAPMPDFNDRAKPEPTKSKTALNLSYGEMVGDVKHLNASSSYSVKTPAGAAGIRGTIYRIVYTPTSDGKAFFTVSTAEGLVVMQGVTTQDIPIAVGKEVVVNVDVPAATTPGTAPTSTPTAPVIVTDIPTETKVLIAAATNTIIAAIQTTTFTPAPTPTTEVPKTEEKKEEPKKEETKTDTPTPPTTETPTNPVPNIPTPPTLPVPTPPTLTSGAGG